MGSYREVIDALDHESLVILDAIIGQSWQGFWAWEYPENLGNFGAWDAIGIQLIDSCVKINTSILDFQFDDEFEDDIGHLSVDVFENCHFVDDDVTFHKLLSGQSILDVLVIREEVRAALHDVPVWAFTNDYGLVFVLESGCVAVYKAMYQGYHLEVSVADSLSQLDIQWGSSMWTDDGDSSEIDTGETFMATHSFRSIRTLSAKG